MITRVMGVWVLVALLAAPIFGVRPAAAASAKEIDAAATAALGKLFAAVPEARDLAGKAKGVLVFPKVYKAGFMFGAQYGEGALRRGGRTVGYYNTVAASYGFQAGAQAFGYALLFMNEGALKYLDKSEGFEVGMGPSVVILDQGKAKSLTTSTIKDDIYGFIFGQQGLMAGAGLQGSKISKLGK
jgi:lipid-binding SYLF domain-containing protein